MPKQETDRWVSMPEDHFRWLLMWHGDFVRELTLLDVQCNGMKCAREHARMSDERRRAFLQSIDGNRPDPSDAPVP